MAARKDDCIFCKIAAGDMGTVFVDETDHVVAFNDISPKAPAHVLVVPKGHYESLHALGSHDGEVWKELLDVVQRVAHKKGIVESGYRVVTNAGPDSGQEVPHLHLHVVGGRKLGPIA